MQLHRSKLSDEERAKWRVAAEHLITSVKVHPDAEQQLHDALFCYLTTDPAARTLLRHLVGASVETIETELRESGKLLVLIHPDGWIELYGSRRLHPRFFTMPPENETAKDRIMAEAKLEEEIPYSLRSLMWPNACESGPGKLCGIRVIVVKGAGHGTGDKYAFTFENCENSWPLQVNAGDRLQASNTSAMEASFHATRHGRQTRKQSDDDVAKYNPGGTVIQSLNDALRATDQ